MMSDQQWQELRRLCGNMIREYRGPSRVIVGSAGAHGVAVIEQKSTGWHCDVNKQGQRIASFVL